MANLIPTDELSTLKSASDVKEVADAAVKIHEEQSVARLINLAANTGEHQAIWEHPLSPELKKVLEGQGYKVTKMSPEFLYRIEGF